ncbi:hypothetical protein QEH52_02150 [Coraliomargarita sp. SDUM461003]|uniref:Beta-xylosidase C-terminal Concanavalin A-like domain-containing protein n=1 Tax=Thalassobacterium maritimum TaxID=3041265 RepID=A0ABU1AQ38_9BACT|nr:hypothetical protein [Coraliomargarita sp. SDUM461003]MDQ8206292.1 hypothetical protein [Coraliomargarita sp. SDUM461003]
MPRIFIACITLCSAVLIAHASAVEVRLMGVEVSRNDLYLKQGTEFVSVDIPLYVNSAYYKAEISEGSLQLYTKIETDEGPRFEVVVEGDFPTGAHSALGIYFIGPGGQIQVYFYDDDWSTFSKRSYRLINISPVSVSSKIEDSLIQVQPFQSGTVQVEIDSNLPLVRVMTVYKDGNDQWKPIYNQRTPFVEDWRITGIAVVTAGKLDQAMGVPAATGAPDVGKAKLSYFSFKDQESTTAQKVAERQNSAK